MTIDDRDSSYWHVSVKDSPEIRTLNTDRKTICRFSMTKLTKRNRRRFMLLWDDKRQVIFRRKK